MIVLKWQGREQYLQDGKSPILVEINTNKKWNWGSVEQALEQGQDIEILGKAEEEE